MARSYFRGRGVVRTRIYDTAISKKFDTRRGSAAEFIRSQLTRTAADAAHRAPKRTGRLAAGYKSSGALRAGPYEAYGYVYNNVAHANWVEKGTKSPITPKNGQFLSVPIARGSTFRVRLQYVRGQRAQHVLRDAAAWARTYRALDAYAARLID